MKASIQIKPGSPVNNESADLLLLAGTNHCCFAVMDHLSKELTAFGYYIFQSNGDDYRDLFEEEELLKSRYNRVFIAYDSCESVFVPSSVYNNDDIQLQLQVIYGKDVQTAVVSENLPEWNLYNVYRLPAKLRNDVQMKFVNGNSLHFYSVMLKNFKSQGSSSMAVDFRTDDFTVMIFREGKVLLARSFSYTAPEDILYYLLKICNELGLSRQELIVTLSGLIEKDSAIYRELYKYFIHLEFDGLYGQVKLAEELKAHPDHYYSSISKLAACVS